MIKLFSNTSFEKLKQTLFWAMIFLGLIIRVLSLSYNGIFDMATYQEWGLNTLNKGLYIAYQGTYFPFQYQVFEFGSWLSEKLNIQYFITYKTVSLLFDAGNLIMLYLIFREFRISKYYLLIYWLHPWFLVMFSQGYCDFHFTFFMLCSLYLTIKGTTRSYLLSGLFLGLALHMKPQVQVVVLAFFIYGCYNYFKIRDLRFFHILVFPLIIFANYSLYFLIMKGNPFTLLKTFVDLPEEMPIAANFLTLWFPFAYYLKKPLDPIYTINDNLIINYFSLRSIALIVLLVMIFFYIRKYYTENRNPEKHENLYMIACFSTFIFPFIMTSAHENHLFLGTVLLIPILGKIKNIPSVFAIHLILILQFINLYGYYGYGENKYFPFIRTQYTYEIANVLSIIAFIPFLYLVYFFLKNKTIFLTTASEK